MAAGKFVSLPRNMPVNHQFPLASSMDLLSSKSPPAEHHTDAYQDVSIHGTLPRKKKAPPPIRSCDNFSHVGTLPHSKSPRQNSPVTPAIIQEQPLQDRKGETFTFRDQHLLDPTLEYVKFSKERHVMDRTPERLKKELEEELLLSGEDLRSHAWYHGRIPRQVSENLVQRDGDFLVRDSLSSPGNFVLTCQWKNLAQHFKIHRTVLRLSEAYSRVQYQFETESFDSIPGLVRCYVGNRRPISQQSGAIIFQPINRTVPLRCLEERYGTSPGRAREGSLAEGRSDVGKRLSLTMGGLQAREQSSTRGNLLRNKEKSGSQPACLDHMQDRRALSLKAHQSESYLPIGCDRGTRPPLCAQDSYVELLTAKQNGAPGPRNSGINYLTLDDDVGAGPWEAPATQKDQGQEDEVEFVPPRLETASSFRPNDFESKLLPPENKPLETAMLKRAKELFTNNDPKVIAQHMLSMDCVVARILEVSEEMRKNMGVSSGLELITLPYGHQLRLDIIERHNTMAIGIAVDILGCTGSLEDRAATLNRIIQVAVELKDSMGDLYSFSAIMKALEMPQITRLEKTWTALRHQYTQTAILYEKQLKPFSKILHEGRESTCVPPNKISVPLLMPLVTLMERQEVTFEGTDMWEKNDESCEIMLNHLATARLMAEAADSYRMNAERILEGFQPDEEMSEIFKTEFQMRLLWGSKGAQVNQTERYEKFNQILTALSRKLEPPPVKQAEL
ncbi:breast cancer anti-estrogen resistance protein 3 isoform X3 [Prionailurus viverrinus]|uniref:breast cancer anti-estrogen resistance protein 3 isoform X3 n=1 Tax=Lynx canadensis TaxID=61383 RepID=UPI0011B0C991|nr:breast cancer anti-estrogen resistance protein 3 isoform X3 [Lynx canadensis]XP_043431539.1 breast cancer anti-estrogen resistance protein 3 isoform X3 [Prionailurus bengalensis]XP_047728528.1 breast cancer anti-estrogen resistance protein 3 isoform X3 [Prionailurus viverrinus]